MIGTLEGMGTFGMILMIASFIFWAWALIEILRSEFHNNINKLIWLLVVFFLYFVGAFLYLFIGRKQRK